MQEQSIQFSTRSPSGRFVLLDDALRKDYSQMVGRDEYMIFEGSSVSLRFEVSVLYHTGLSC